MCCVLCFVWALASVPSGRLRAGNENVCRGHPLSAHHTHTGLSNFQTFKLSNNLRLCFLVAFVPFFEQHRNVAFVLVLWFVFGVCVCFVSAFEV